MTAVLAPRERQPQLSPDPLRAPTTQRYFLDDHHIPFKLPMHDDYQNQECSSTVASTISSIPPSPNFTATAQNQLPYTPTNLSSLSLDQDLILPSFDTEPSARPAPKESDIQSDASVEGSTLPSAARRCSTPAADDTSIQTEPSRHVDYLSHEWREEDIWASWRYVTSRKNDYSNGMRLENASWRTWAKAKHNLGTISPETLNWYSARTMKLTTGRLH